MKALPENITLRPAMYGDGENGMAFQVQRNDEYGVQLAAIRVKHGAPWIETYTSDFLPNCEFKSYSDLHAAVMAALERGALVKHIPAIVSVELKGQGTGHCWICKGEWLHTVITKTGWRDMDQSRIPCCGDHLEQVKSDPLAAIEARHKAVHESELLRQHEDEL